MRLAINNEGVNLLMSLHVELFLVGADGSLLSGPVGKAIHIPDRDI